MAEGVSVAVGVAVVVGVGVCEGVLVLKNCATVDGSVHAEMEPISRLNMKRIIILLFLHMISPLADQTFEFRFGFFKDQCLTFIL